MILLKKETERMIMVCFLLFFLFPFFPLFLKSFIESYFYSRHVIFAEKPEKRKKEEMRLRTLFLCLFIFRPHLRQCRRQQLRTMRCLRSPLCKVFLQGLFQSYLSPYCICSQVASFLP